MDNLTNEISQQDLTDSEKDEIAEQLSDPLWRIRNLYAIVDKMGVEVPFRPTKPQEVLINAYYIEKKQRHIILKARRLGFSTLIDLILFDAVYWGENLQASIVDLTQGDASEKLKTKVKFAYEHLPPAMKEALQGDNEKSMTFGNGSTINAGKNARGGTNQLLHVSELGPIAHEDPKRAEEVKTGALPSADVGAIFIESTFKGGKGGVFYDMIKTSMETPDEYKTSKDYWLHFFPWWQDETLHLQGDMRAISKSTNDYLDQKELELGIKFVDTQRLWYHVALKEQGIFIKREYPTTLDEAFAAPVEGAIYGDVINAARKNEQIHDFLIDRSVPIFCGFDIGWSDSTTVWMFQINGREVHWLWYCQVSHRTPSDVMALIRNTEIPIAGYILPHDARQTAASGGVTYEQQLIAAGALNVVVLDRPKDRWGGINAGREIISRSRFRRTETSDGVEALEAYHTKPISSGGVTSKEPVHDWSSHGADGFRVCCEAIMTGRVRSRDGNKMRDMPISVRKGQLIDIDTIRQNRKNSRVMKAKSGIRL